MRWAMSSIDSGACDGVLAALMVVVVVAFVAQRIHLSTSGGIG